jgi:predicted DNA-binding transcriptional regulator YafY
VTSSRKLERWLDLIAYLVGHRYPVTVEQILESVPAYRSPHETDDKTELDSSRRKFERDKDELRELGIPIETVRFSLNDGMEQVEGYRLARRDFYLPYLRLIGSEAGEQTRRIGIDHVEIATEDLSIVREATRQVAALSSFPLRREAETALRKVSFDLTDPRGADRPPVHYLERPNAEEVAATMRKLSDALMRRKRVKFEYHGIYRGKTTSRDVAPYALLFQSGHWYMIGHDALRDAQRVFRVDRMEDATPNRSRPKQPDYEIPDDFDVAENRHRPVWRMGGSDEPPLAVEVEFAFPRSLWAERNAHGQLVRSGPDGSAVRSFQVEQVDPFLRWILSQAGDAQILGPPELQDAYHRLLQDVGAIYRKDP